MISGLGKRLDRFAHRFMPDPFLLAVGLTFVVLIAGLALGEFAADAGFLERLRVAVGGWKQFIFEPPTNDGGVNRKLLYFAFQMCLMLVTGHALASSPPVARLVSRLAALPRSFGAGVVLVAFVACGMALVHWGLGLIVGAMIAREVGRSAAARNIAHHYPLLGAAGYTGLMIWGGGLSGSIPLAAQDQVGIPLSETMFSGMNLVISGALLLAIPLFCYLLVPRDPQGYVPCDLPAADPESQEPPTPPSADRVGLAAGGLAGVAAAVYYLGQVGADRWPVFIYAALNAGIVTIVVRRAVGLLGRAFTVDADRGETHAERIERSEVVVLLICLMALGWLEWEVLSGAFKLSFNNLNFAFLFLGLLFQGTPIRYVRAVGEGARGCAGIILQFPLYFGILGLLVATSLAAVISAAMVASANETTLPVFTYFSAGFVNLFVPSGGGQWVVQGKIVIDAAGGVGGGLSESILALTYGDAWTNMLQPFWAVPLLAITGLKARDIIGFTATVMILGGFLTVALLLLL